MDWHGEVEEVKSQPIVLILPGLHFERTISMQLLHIDTTSRCLDTISFQSKIYSQGVCRMIDKNLTAGLTGSSQSEYVKTFVTVAKEEVRSLVLHVSYVTLSN